MRNTKLTDYDLIILNSSAGKDSQAMIDYVMGLVDAVNYPKDRIVVAHADLGRIEWNGTIELGKEQADHYNLRFETMKRPQGDLLEHVYARKMWPSSSARYCTSDHKRGQISKIVTKLTDEVRGDSNKQIKILNCLGIRAQESPARAKKASFSRDNRLSNGKRAVDTWYPIFEWTEKEVWDTIKASGVSYHPAYDAGMPRLSCQFCVFAPKAALIIAGKANPELLDEYVKCEEEIGHTFRQDFSIAEVKDAINNNEEAEMIASWNM
tara:strand:+ start:55 stop:852 length:798 start_codon:yes stop_codon:yes gene_type:complete